MARASGRAAAAGLMSTGAGMVVPDVVSLAQTLIRIPSVTGNERAIAAYIRDYLDELGFACVIDAYNTITGVFSFGPGPVLLMDAHIDTVDANPGAWQYPPYAGVIAGNRLYGRGAADMKGALSAMLVAAATLVRRDGLSGTLVFTGSSWEERFEGYTLGKACEALAAQGIVPDYALIGEASELNLKRGQRGRARVLVQIEGRAAHSAHPDAGTNAVYKAMSFIQALRAAPVRRDPFLGPRIIELIGIHSLPNPVDSVVPFACEIAYDLRLLPGDAQASVLAQFDDVIAACRREDPAFVAQVHVATESLSRADGGSEIVTVVPPAWILAEDHPYVRQARCASQSIGLDPDITKYDFCTNGSYTAGIAGIPTLGFGPGKETTAHIVDEYVDLVELEAAMQGYVAIVASLLRRHQV